MSKKFVLIYTDGAEEEAAECLAPAHLATALEACGATVDVLRTTEGDAAVLDALAGGAVPVVIRPRTAP